MRRKGSKTLHTVPLSIICSGSKCACPARVKHAVMTHPFSGRRGHQIYKEFWKTGHKAYAIRSNLKSPHEDSEHYGDMKTRQKCPELLLGVISAALQYGTSLLLLAFQSSISQCLVMST